MRTTKSPPLTIHQWEELTHVKPDPIQLENIEAQLDLLLLALEALAGIGTDAMLQAATHLNLEPSLSNHMLLWQQSSNSLYQNEAAQPKLNVEAARSLVLIVCYLAKQHQELIRRAVTLLEQQAANHRDPREVALIEEYINTFNQIYSQRDSNNIASVAVLNNLALKLLVELLFYSGPFGHRRLWLVLLDR